jgi:hypothetical protein
MSGIYNALEERLIDLLDPLPGEALEANWSDAELTRQLANKLAAAGKEAGLLVCSGHGAKADQDQWLHDLAWLEMEGPRLRRVRLALEVEWSLEEEKIIPEFQKLLAARADLRVMVLQQKTKDQAGQRLEALTAHLEAFGQSQPGDRYLLACSDFKSAAFQYRLHICA